MASKKTGIGNMTRNTAGSLAATLLKMIAAGVAGGALLISGAKTVGEALLAKEESDMKRLEERREADREAVRRIMENDPD